MRKYISATIAVLICVFVLAGCGQQDRQKSMGDKPSIIASIFPPYDFMRAIAGDKADITMLLPPGSESHSFEPTAQDVIKIQNCDIFIYVGGESDEWISGILESIDTSKMRIITLMDCVEVVEEEIVEGMEDEEEEEEDDQSKSGEDEEPEYDEHVWTSPKNAKLIVQKISDTLCEVDAANAETYKQNTTTYLGRLDELDGKFQAVVDAAVRKTMVFGDRFPFRYFADAYGLAYFAAFPGCSNETEASAATVAFLIDKVRDENIPVVFHIEFGNEDMANAISEATGAKVRLLHACHNISATDFTADKTYIDIMTANVDALKEALQ